MSLLVSDFDHTFYTEEYKENIEAIRSFTDNGNIFVIATGRNLYSLLQAIGDNSIPISFYICNDGAIIYDDHFNIIYEKKMKKEVTQFLWEALTRETELFSEVLIDFQGKYVHEKKYETNKIIAKPKNLKKAKIWFQELREMKLEITGYFSLNWLNIMDKSVNKGHAIEILKQQGKILDNEIYTIGDDRNDIDMIQKYHGYSISSAPLVEHIKVETVKNVRELVEKIEQAEACSI